MAINLYRRHRSECEAGHPEESRSGEFEERKKGFKHCACLIFASGTLNGKFRRKSTGLSDWEQARALVAQWTSWDVEVPPFGPPPAPAPQTSTSHRITIEQCIKSYNADIANTHAASTIREYNGLLKEFIDFSLDKGFVYIDQWTTADVREFRACWNKISKQTGETIPLKNSTVRKKMANLKAFLRFIESNRWLKENPAKLIRERHTRKDRENDNAPRIPFTDDELNRMFAACANKYATTGNYRYRWTGKDLADFISVSIYTGLRISDVATFRADRLKPNGECRIRTTKNGNTVSTWIPGWLQERIHARQEEHGPLIFGDHETADMNVVTDLWRRKLKKLWALCGPWPAAPTPHRFRHTFARILLQKGISLQDVATLLGDTETVVRKHYAQWVPERQARLTEILQEAFTDKPKPNVLSFPARP